MQIKNLFGTEESKDIGESKMLLNLSPEEYNKLNKGKETDAYRFFNKS